MTGRLSAHPRGFGFIVPATTGAVPPVSLFVPPPEMRGLMADDRVRAEIVEQDDGRTIARGVELLERRRALVYGEVVDRRGRLSLVVDPEIATGEWDFDAGTAQLEDGDAVIARVDGDRLRVVRRLAHDADRSWHRILARHELNEDYPSAVMREAREVAERPHAASEADPRRAESGSRGAESGSRGAVSGSRGAESGSRGVESGSRGVESGSRGVESGSRGAVSGSRGAESGSRGAASGSRVAAPAARGAAPAARVEETAQRRAEAARGAETAQRAEPRHRRDLRNVPTITVDASSTRDIDDAISVLPPSKDGAVRLLVSIADVAEFVAAGGPLDREARVRATSVYLPDGVLPMLPETLSSGHLSLLPDEERCCLTAELRIDPEGTILSVDVYESLIRSFGRVTYDEMAAYLDEHRITPATRPVADALPLFRAAAARLGIARLRRGGVQFARDEARVNVDPQTGAPTELSTLRTTTAHQMIERFMVAANEAIATWLNARGVPALYRVHEPPDAGRTEALDAIAKNFGFEAAFGGRITPLSLAVLDSQIARTPWENLVRSAMLRALGPARYTVDPLPHFGLAAPLYLHFTSPIRRYADLVVHRAVKSYLRGERPADALEPAYRTLADHLNERSGASGRAERDRTSVMQARWFADQIGSRHRARITRVRASGLTLQLEGAQVEGTLPADALPQGPYRPDTHEVALVSARRRYMIGMPLSVRIRNVDADLGRIELELDESAPRR